MINTELFAKIRDVIKDQPGRHDQSRWESTLSGCGTARCVAGWAIHLTTGKKVVYWEPGLSSIEVSPSVRALAAERDIQADPDDGDGVPLIPVLAASLLGLTEAQADILFYADNGEALNCVELAADGDLYGFERALDLIEQSE